ncbi:MAG: PilT/PilU family type 4a pilus ATPase [Actinomycetota bacterium]|nr:PilT/PilU family type 4a pilus ATPase [Actinomycetota bacterium]
MDEPLPSLDELLEKLTAVGGSDLHLKIGSPPAFRIDGVVHRSELAEVAPGDTVRYLDEIATDRASEALESSGEADFAIGRSGLGRFRVSVFRQRGSLTLVLRTVGTVAGGFEALGLPAVVEQLADERPGLLLITGPSGSGRTTTAAAVVEYINATRKNSIVTIEDPIESLFPDNQSLVSQREVGLDTASFASGVQAAMRNDTDVMFVGDLPDRDTVAAALRASETGHLVIAILPTFDGLETINRIVESFEPYQRHQVRQILSTTLKGIISQQLIPRADGKGRVAAVEVLVNTERIAEKLKDEETTASIAVDVAEGEFFGMRNYDQAILTLYARGDLTFEDAVSHATSTTDFKVAAQSSGVMSA